MRMAGGPMRGAAKDPLNRDAPLPRVRVIRPGEADEDGGAAKGDASRLDRLEVSETCRRVIWPGSPACCARSIMIRDYGGAMRVVGSSCPDGPGERFYGKRVNAP